MSKRENDPNCPDHQERLGFRNEWGRQKAQIFGKIILWGGAGLMLLLIGFLMLNTLTGWVTAPFSIAKDTVTNIDLWPNEIVGGAWESLFGSDDDSVTTETTLTTSHQVDHTATDDESQCTLWGRNVPAWATTCK